MRHKAIFDHYCGRKNLWGKNYLLVISKEFRANADALNYFIQRIISYTHITAYYEKLIAVISREHLQYIKSVQRITKYTVQNATNITKVHFNRVARLNYPLEWIDDCKQFEYLRQFVNINPNLNSDFKQTLPEIIEQSKYKYKYLVRAYNYLTSIL